ncbi:DUF928 domain-containing protein [Nostoc sp.]|uniref:DUF928 domain-containing protein n=1 Tax=Nostoc sp. TaxID=1180 RepID=UPI002FF9D207
MNPKTNPKIPCHFFCDSSGCGIWVKRVEQNAILKSQLETATPKQRVALYATNGIWYDSLTASTELRRLDPKHTDWAAMLQAVGLNNIASEPIVDCCQ